MTRMRTHSVPIRLCSSNRYRHRENPFCERRTPANTDWCREAGKQPRFARRELTDRNEQRQIRGYPSHSGTAKKSARVLSYRPSLKELEEEVFDKLLEEIQERMTELSNEIRELKARAKSLRKERELSMSQSTAHAHTQMRVEDPYCATPHPDSVVSDELVVETQDGENCFWLTSDNASPTPIGEDPVVSTADPVKEISPSPDIIATDVLKEVTAQKEPPTLSAVTPVALNVTEVEKEVRQGADKPLASSPLTALDAHFAQYIGTFHLHY